MPSFISQLFNRGTYIDGYGVERKNSFMPNNPILKMLGMKDDLVDRRMNKFEMPIIPEEVVLQGGPTLWKHGESLFNWIKSQNKVSEMTKGIKQLWSVGLEDLAKEAEDFLKKFKSATEISKAERTAAKATKEAEKARKAYWTNVLKQRKNREIEQLKTLDNFPEIANDLVLKNGGILKRIK